MVRMQPWLARLAVALVLLPAAGASAIYLDEDQNVQFRARIYSQASIRTENSGPDTAPHTFSGQLIQNRNYANPELDAKLTPYLTWMEGGGMNWLSPDDLRFRIAAWAFYDGIYDYGSAQFNQSQKIINDTFNNDVPREPNGNIRQGGWFITGQNVKLCRKDPQTGKCQPNTQFAQVFPGYELYVPRSIYANTERVNELYLSYSKGPFFLRVGRQSISWGESDTVALLDQSNPFDITLAAPGFFEDLEESRIPLYTIRTSYNVFDVLGPMSSGFVEGYWVPGGIDATTATVPLLTASPYSPRGTDPQLSSQMPGGVFPPTFQFVFLDHKPKEDFSSSRWGVRFQTVVNRFLTAQAWVYRTFPQSPVPVKIGQQNNLPFNINGTNFFIVSLEHKPVMVYGLAGTFYSDWVDGIFRLNAQFFEHEAGFIPEHNLNVCPVSPQDPTQCPKGTNGVRRNPISSPGSIPYADILRYEVGFDRFFFLRFLNPTNSFVLSSSAVGSYNASETSSPAHDFKFNGQLKPGLVRRVPGGQLQTRGAFQEDFVNANALDAQFQVTLQTDYLHGRLEPRSTLIQFVRGTFAWHPSITYRWTDWLLLQADYQMISGAYQSLGFFRDRDQFSFRITYQLN